MQLRGQGHTAAALLLAVLLVGVAATDAIRVIHSQASHEEFLTNDDFSATPRRKLQQLPKSPSAQIFLDGILQDATLDAACATSKFCGGTLTVNNELVTVPKNLMVMFPANALTWQEIFNGGTKTGLAMADPPTVTGATYSVSVVANRVGSKIIAGLVDITQDALVGGSGYIDSISYATGEITIEANGGAGSGAKIRFNDPLGRFGIKQTSASFDYRFIVDPDNPTIRSATGFPMCIPRTEPTGAATGDDPLCPLTTNRPGWDAASPPTIVNMNTPGNNPNPLKMVPFIVGDYITFSGVLTNAGFVAAYEVVNNVAVYTSPGVDPAFTVFETAIIGTGGLNTLGAGEAAVRSRFEGFTTDWTRPVQLWALDFKLDGTYSKRDLGQVMPDPGPAGGVGATQGRWRFRPPCTNTAGPLKVGDPYLGNKGCTAPPGGVYTPPTREVMADIVGCTSSVNATNGIVSGDGPGAGCQYRNPTIEYIWPENVPGAPIVENNFQVVPFLTQGGYTSGMGTVVSTLDPWPSNVLPQDSCLPPTIVVDGPLSVQTGGAVTVSASVSGPGQPFTYAWVADAPAIGGSTLLANSLSTTFNPVLGSTTYTFSVTNTCGKSFTKQATVNAVAAAKSAIQTILPQTVKSGTTNVAITAKLSGTGTDTFQWTFPSGIAKINQTANPTAASTIFFNAPVLLPNTVTSTVLTFSVNTFDVATNLVTSDVASTTVTVRPPPDFVALTAVAFRCDKHRLTLTASSTVNDPNVQLTLQNYIDNQNKTVNTAALGNQFTNTGGGIHTITIEPVPLPSTTVAGLKVTSNLGGSDAVKVTAAQITKGPCSI